MTPSEPRVGIVFLVRGQVFLESTPLSEAEVHAGCKDHEGGHAQFWKELLANRAIPVGSEYDEYPRGRIVYHLATQRFAMMLDRCFQDHRDVVTTIIESLYLPADRVYESDDSHYVCPDCQRARVTNQQRLATTEVHSRQSGGSGVRRKSMHTSNEAKRESLVLVLISDTHELHRDLVIPNGDLLIHAGDITMNSMSAEKLLDFNDWLGELPHAFRIVVPGNHDFVLEDPSRRTLISNATLLINQSVEIMGLKIWGSAVTPFLGEAFGVASDRDRAKLYSPIPTDTDVLVTHGPPYGILDKAPDSEVHQGCKQLLTAVRRVRPIIHVFGHVHGGYGTFSTQDTLFVNAALPGHGYDLSNRPHVFKLPRR